MPIEIMELVIKAKVSTPNTAEAGGEDTTTGQPDQAALEPVEKAVKEILDILKRKNER